ncbi:hypothetical protein I79_010031 [Cricetulus griseus]|uniref:Uncharacterized protein n=1 Tax=Cricetulus griseus TaxID=10029 RepID=G3HHD2_CRIGR|nr:hypothetical protein I79_010031 [Cricetulus griseus]
MTKTSVMTNVPKVHPDANGCYSFPKQLLWVTVTKQHPGPFCSSLENMQQHEVFY